MNAAVRNITSHRKRNRRKRNNIPNVCVPVLNSAYTYGQNNTRHWEVNVPVWFWSNYFKAKEWQNKHTAALWKSYALALLQENRNLMVKLLQKFPDQFFHAPISFQNLDFVDLTPCSKCIMMKKLEEDAEMECNYGNDKIEYEMSEEMITFFEQSIKHKLEMKRLKEEKEEYDSVNVRELLEADNQREKEMNLLYGDDSSMIIGMETAVQLGFDKYCYLQSPIHWPNIPLNI